MSRKHFYNINALYNFSFLELISEEQSYRNSVWIDKDHDTLFFLNLGLLKS